MFFFLVRTLAPTQFSWFVLLHQGLSFLCSCTNITTQHMSRPRIHGSKCRVEVHFLEVMIFALLLLLLFVHHEYMLSACSVHAISACSMLLLVHHQCMLCALWCKATLNSFECCHLSEWLYASYYLSRTRIAQCKNKMCKMLACNFLHLFVFAFAHACVFQSLCMQLCVQMHVCAMCASACTYCTTVIL